MRIALVANEVRGGWHPLDLGSVAGGEEIIVKFSQALARRGHLVRVLYDGPYIGNSDLGGVAPGSVEFCPRDLPLEPYDIQFHFKSPEHAGLDLAPRKYLWTDQERPFQPDPFTKVVACSEYLKRYIASACPRAASRLTVIPYGIDCAEVLAAGDGITRDPLEVLHCASPDRGLDVFLDLWPQVLARVPAAHLTIAYGWELYDKYGGSPALKAKIMGQLAVLMEQGARITMRRLSRLEMHQVLHRAAVYAYWCTGGEQFGLTALKAQLAGCVPVVKPWGGLHETVRQEFHVVDTGALVGRMIGTLTDPPLADGTVFPDWAKISGWAQQFDWDRIVTQWETLWADDAKPVALTSEVVAVPGAPPFAEPIGSNLLPAAHGLIAEWMQAVQPQRPWIDPTLGYPLGPAPTPADADAILLGFTFEDDPDLPGRVLRRLCARPNTPVLVLVSHGTWRRTKRQRAFSPADLTSLVGQCPDFQLRAIALNGDGDGVTVLSFRFIPERIMDDREPTRVRRIQAPRDTLSACFMVRDVAHTFGITLNHLVPIVDEVCIVDTGSSDSTPDLVNDWRRRTGIDVRYEPGTSPRWCYDCQREHAIGEMGFGHRVAGFETPRNQSIAHARGDWIAWLDADEELLGTTALGKYLRPNLYDGYGIPQHHHSVNPPEAGKVDYPVRLFRRRPDETPPGLVPFGPEQWPTYHSGLHTRFTGIVHEHPGHAPGYTDGLGPVIILSDVWIAHRGYYTEDGRRRRFVRNWPLMVADRAKYPCRRLGRFLWIRDLSHQLRYLIESQGGQLTPETAQLAEEGWRIFCDEFAGTADAYAADAAMFAETCAQVLGRGVRYEVSVRATKPEVAGPDDAVVAQFTGRFRDDAQMLAALKARLADTSRWEGPYI